VNGFREGNIADVLADPTTARNTLALGALRGDIDTTSDAQTILIGRTSAPSSRRGSRRRSRRDEDRTGRSSLHLRRARAL